MNGVSVRRAGAGLHPVGLGLTVAGHTQVRKGTRLGRGVVTAGYITSAVMSVVAGGPHVGRRIEDDRRAPVPEPRHRGAAARIDDGTIVTDDGRVLHRQDG